MSRLVLIGAVIWIAALGGAGLYATQFWDSHAASLVKIKPANDAVRIQTAQASQPAQQTYPGWLNLPVQCAIGQDCWPLQQFDHQPGPGYQDYSCGDRAYDGHDGIDFGLATFADMRRSVAVVAAAPGRILRVRDGEQDGIVAARGLAAIPKDRMCGNGVLIEHGGGWQTQYCHMARGSVSVQSGQTIAAGAKLGEIGMSGAADFAHLHFEVRHGYRSYDPFLPGGLKSGQCGSRQSLWTPSAQSALHYSPLDLVAVGLSDSKPTYKSVIAGTQNSRTASSTADALYAWALAWNTKPGDVLTLQFAGPNGRTILTERLSLQKGHRLHMQFAGKRAQGQWPAGAYSVSAKYERAGAAPTVRQRRQTVNLQ